MKKILKTIAILMGYLCIITAICLIIVISPSWLKWTLFGICVICKGYFIYDKLKKEK